MINNMEIKTKINNPKNCISCKEKIHDDDKFVLLGIYKEEKVMDEAFFHYRCYLEWIEKRIREHSANQMNQAMNQSLGGLQPLISKLTNFMDG